MEKQTQTQTPIDLVPMSVEKASAIALHPTAKGGDTALASVYWGSRAIGFMELTPGRLQHRSELHRIGFISAMSLFNECEPLGDRIELFQTLKDFPVPLFLLDEAPLGKSLFYKLSAFEPIHITPIYRFSKNEPNKVPSRSFHMEPTHLVRMEPNVTNETKFVRDSSEINWRLKHFSQMPQSFGSHYFENLAQNSKQMAFKIQFEGETDIHWVTFYCFEETKTGKRIGRLLDRSMDHESIAWILEKAYQALDVDFIETAFPLTNWRGEIDRYRTYFYCGSKNTVCDFTQCKFEGELADGQFGFRV